MVTGEMAIAILPKSEFPKMELVNPEEEYETILWNFNKLLLKFYPNTRVRR